MKKKSDFDGAVARDLRVGALQPEPAVVGAGCVAHEPDVVVDGPW